MVHSASTRANATAAAASIGRHPRGSMTRAEDAPLGDAERARRIAVAEIERLEAIARAEGDQRDGGENAGGRSEFPGKRRTQENPRAKSRQGWRGAGRAGRKRRCGRQIGGSPAGRPARVREAAHPPLPRPATRRLSHSGDQLKGMRELQLYPAGSSSDAPASPSKFSDAAATRQLSVPGIF